MNKVGENNDDVSFGSKTELKPIEIDASAILKTP